MSTSSWLSAPALIALAASPLAGQRLQTRLAEVQRGWESLLEKGDGGAVQKAAEAMLARETPVANPTDYNDQRTLVALHDMAARGAVLDGAWEAAVTHLKAAVDLSTANLEQAEKTLGRAIQDHEAHLTITRAAVAQLESKLQEFAQADGLPQQLIEARDRARQSLSQHKASVTHSEQSIVEIRNVLAQLRKVRETYAASHEGWRAFLEAEKAELAKAGSPERYAAQKLEQVKADDAKPRTERLSYGRRILRHDAANADAKRFVDGLMGIESEPPEAPKETKKSPSRKRKKA